VRKDRSLGSMSIEQIHSLIANAVKAQLGGGSYKTHLYTKPYTKRIDALSMPCGYQPPKFNQFDGKGNPKQHIAHFIETCSNAGTEGDRLVKQFVRSLKGIAFDWYINLEPESINSWGQMKQEFLNKFYSTRCVVSLIKLTSPRQWKEESVLDSSTVGGPSILSATIPFLKLQLSKCVLKAWNGIYCMLCK